MCVKGAQKKGRPRSVRSAFIIRAACYRQEFRPSVVAMADRILITVWIMIFQVSLFFIIIKRPPLPPLGHLTSVAQRTVLPSPRHGLTFSQSSEGLVRPLWGDFVLSGVLIKG